MTDSSPRHPANQAPLSKDEIISELRDAQAEDVAAYLASIIDQEAEVKRLTELFAACDEIEPTGTRYKAFRVRLRALGPDHWPAALLARYEKARHWQDRLTCVFAAIPFAGDTAAAIKLGLRAISDRSYHVRQRAHQILAYGLQQSCVPAMQKRLRTETREEARESLMAAIHAIERQNHHLYLDRNETGRVHWRANPWDYDDPTLQRTSITSMKRYDRRSWAATV